MRRTTAVEARFAQHIAVTQHNGAVAPYVNPDAPRWLHQLVAASCMPQAKYSYRDISKLYRTGGHLLFDALLKENQIQSFHYFTENRPAERHINAAASTASVASVAATTSKSDDKQTQQTAAQIQQLDAPIWYPEVLACFHLGSEVSGHKGVVHGGLTAALCDEVCGTVSYLSLHGQPSFTANLSIDYRAPIHSNSYVMVRARVQRQERRKIYIACSVEDGAGKVYAQGTALFVQPKSSIAQTLAKLWNKF